MSVTEQSLLNIKSEFERRSGLRGLSHEIRKASSGDVLVIFVNQPNERLFELLNASVSASFEDHDDRLLATLKTKSTDKIVDSAEARLFIKILSESLNVNRFSFKDDFFEKYTRTVGGAEEQITSAANHVVFGRRGAGKSMLLLYSLKNRQEDSSRSVWVDLQAYSGRTDDGVISDVLSDMIVELEKQLFEASELRSIQNDISIASDDLESVRRILPRLRRFLSRFTGDSPIFIFLDDLHVVDLALQAKLVDVIYSVCRGNNAFLKISAIENLTKLYDHTNRVGLEIPHDAQAIRLDYNLTTPEKTSEHIEAILRSHAKYAGLSGIRRLCSSSDVLPRLTWVSAGVPRDALYLFSQAIQKASVETRDRVTVSNVNQAASEAITSKLRDLEADASRQADRLKKTLERIKEFCIREKRKNAFLVEISGESEVYADVTSLAQLRLLHVVSEGITPKEAGKKYLALILDYGLYIGVRAAKSVELFNKAFDDSSYSKLRSLPILKEANSTRS